MPLFFILILLFFTPLYAIETDNDFPFIEPLTEEELNLPSYLDEEKLMLMITLEDLILSGNAGTVNGVSSSSVSVSLLAFDRKKPSGNDEYYVINGNADITIQGHDKQKLYNNATTYWSKDASYTLPVSNVGILTYGDTTLNDIVALQTGTDYSEFIENVTLNGFKTDYEYRLELNNGSVILWSKLPGDNPPVVPEASSTVLLLASLVIVSNKRKRL